MNNDVVITQKAAMASRETTQIGVQINGINAEQASQIAINLFRDNFPKLQEEARKIARERAEELCNEIINKLDIQGKKDFSEFTDPDIQFVLSKSQQEYARFGTKELLELLSEIVINRINYNYDYYMKILIDKAIDVAEFLTPAQLNYLSIIFLCKHVIFKEINSIQSLKKICDHISAMLPVPTNIAESISLLSMLQLFVLSVNLVGDYLAKTYGLDVDAVNSVLPKSIQSMPDDYALSPLGILLAIINAKKKTDISIEYETWLKMD